MKTNELLIWIFTAVAALAIIGGAVFFVKRQQALNEQPILVPPAPAVEMIEPEPEPEIIEEPPVDIFQPIETPDAPPAPVAQQPKTTGKPKLDLSNVAGLIELDVPFMRIRDKMPLDHSCFQENISPALEWRKAPSDTKSYVVFMERRDAGWQKGDEGYVTWTIYNIPENKGGLGPSIPQSSSLPDGSKQGTADHGTVGYIGPCEAMGKFTYALRVFALDIVLDVPANLAKYDLINAMNGHIIDTDEVEFIHYRRF